VVLRADGADLGDRDLEVREHLEQKRLELLVGPVDLVDQQHDALRALDRLEQRAPDQELRPEELLLGDRSLLRGPDVEELARVVPFVDRVGDVEALVALKTDQARAEDARERLRRLGLADAGLAFQQQRLLEPKREEERRREPAVREVGGRVEGVMELVDRGRGHRPTVVARRRRAAPPFRRRDASHAPGPERLEAFATPGRLVPVARTQASGRSLSFFSAVSVQGVV
jgi:hypothetical protein